MLILDTHALLWLMFGSPDLGSAARKTIDKASAEGQVGISAISLWEIATLIRLRRLRIEEELRSWRAKIAAIGISEIAIGGDIAITAGEMDIGVRDPSDRLIAATTLVIGATLVTADRRLLEWTSSVRRIDARR